MPKYDDFDLDIQVKEVSNIEAPNITSMSMCTPGTCWNTCGGTSTLNTNCCIGTYLCSLAESCR